MKLRLFALIFLMQMFLFPLTEVAVGQSGRIAISATSLRRNFLRMEEEAIVAVEVVSRSRQPLNDAGLRVYMGESMFQEIALPDLEFGERHGLDIIVDTRVRAGEYDLRIVAESQEAAGEANIPIKIVERKLPYVMPVMDWMFSGTPGQAKEIGFTHTFFRGGIDHALVWNTGAPVRQAAERELRTVDEALGHGFNMVVAPPGASFRMEDGKFGRVDWEGKPYERYNVCGLFNEVKKFCYNIGASIAEAYHDYPGLDWAMVHSEIRDRTNPCFHEHDYEAFREHAGIEIPRRIVKASTWPPSAVDYRGFRDFPGSRIIPDDDPILTYYRWFWKEGDSWNNLHTQMHRGLKSKGKNIRTFHDPAVRVPSLWGSAGGLDSISQWTYCYPYPEMTGLATDELFAMAKGASNPEQDVMKMTQTIWRRHVAPAGQKGEGGYLASWERDFPDAVMITIPPDFLSLSLWSKISRPIKGIMYHGLWSLIPGEPGHGYAYTNPETEEILRRLIREVIEPLGPALMQVPDANTDVAFLQSFASQIYAGKGTFGWGRGWGAISYLVARYAQLQPEIVYEETVLEEGLDRFKVLFMTDCDVITESVARKIVDFQMMGGIVVGDENLAPGLSADITMLSIPSQFSQPPDDGDKKMRVILDKAEWLRGEIDMYISRMTDTGNPRVLTRLRRYGSSDYLFAYNDSRKFGRYIGHHGRVMEDGVPESAVIRLERAGGHVYDLLSGKEVQSVLREGWLEFEHDFGPAEGGLWLVTERPLGGVTVKSPISAVRGSSFDINILVEDDLGEAVDAVVPVRVGIVDPTGLEMEFSGYYGAKDGRINITYDISLNDEIGSWKVIATELASGRTGKAYINVE